MTFQEIGSKTQLEKFVQSQPENVLTVVNVSSNNATPCVRVFPAVMALAKNFTGYAAFARLLYETSQETQSLANELRVLEVSLWVLAGFERQPLFSDRLLHSDFMKTHTLDGELHVLEVSLSAWTPCPTQSVPPPSCCMSSCRGVGCFRGAGSA